MFTLQGFFAYPMKRIVLFFTMLVFLLSCKTQGNGSADTSEDSTTGPYMYFKQETRDMGKVKQGDTVFCTFLVENRGKADLLIKGVSPSCGCTVAQYDQKPIPPKGSGKISLIFATNNRQGKVTKSATVYSNAHPETKVINFKCEIVLPNKSK